MILKPTRPFRMDSKKHKTDIYKQIPTSEIKNDYRLAFLSRQLSIIGRKEVLTGKAKFGIFGDGKELAQIALAKVFLNGDWRSGYYRDQTLMLAIGLLTPKQFFAQLYGDTNLENNPANGGRLMNNHFASRSINADGTWKNLCEQKNSSPDISPTAGQMPRLLGLAQASKVFRNNPELSKHKHLSINGNEVAFGTIGDSSTSEGHFWETINAAGVLQVPMAMSVWDDGWGISVPNKYQTTKQNISEVLKGFERTDTEDGYIIYRAKGWDYLELCQMYQEGVAICRKEQTPALFHVNEITQPQGHSSSGSHERYKSAERMIFEEKFDCIVKMKEWMLAENIADQEFFDNIHQEVIAEVSDARKQSFIDYQKPIRDERDQLLELIEKNCLSVDKNNKLDLIVSKLKKSLYPNRKELFSSVKEILRHVCFNNNDFNDLRDELTKYLSLGLEENLERFSSELYTHEAMSVADVKPVYTNTSKTVNGREVLRDNFNKLFETNPLLMTFGQDTGFIGGVNQSLEGLQEKYGKTRIADAGIREATIMGQAIGLSLRGLRPIAEIQYFDYLVYAIQTMSDDLATMLYRTKAGQRAPVIVRTRGHRLEGIWHSGSPLSMVINSIRGMYVCVPRNMTKAAGFYNLLSNAEEPALVIEPLNGYRLKEKMPDNIGQFTTALGVPEIMVEGKDITLVTYGSCVRIAETAVKQLAEFNISVELIDVQTLLPFDINNVILESVKKTSRVVFFDEDVPGGATAFMMQKVVEGQNAYKYLDSAPVCISAKDHRPAYGTDGDYFSNPNAEDVFEKLYAIMEETNPEKYKNIYK